MPSTNRVSLPGSARRLLAGSEKISAVSPEEPILVTVVLRRKGPLPPAEPCHCISRAQFAENHGARPDDIQMVEQFAQEYGLSIVGSYAPQRRVVLSGAAKDMERAFGVTLGHYEDANTGVRYRGRQGEISVPAELKPAVIAVLGLDNRPMARSHIRYRPSANSGTAGTFTPPQVAKLYNYPAGLTGSGQTVGIIELGGGYTPSDLSTYFGQLGISPAPKVSSVSVDGGANTPGSDADGEVMLDIEVIGSIAPDVNIVVYFAPNTDQGFLDAITTAVHDTTNKPSVVSISWGGPEDSWTAQSLTAMNSAIEDGSTLGVTITVAAGDDGSTDGSSDGSQQVDFPASSPWSLACGGTTLVGSGSTIQSEVVWNDLSSNEGGTGGGVSTTFPIPSYQSNANVPAQPATGFAGRGVPDVAGDADPETGYQVLVDGQSEVVGGTSAVAPLWAALMAMVNQQMVTSGSSAVGFANPVLYQNSSDFHDITQGNNGTYDAGPGWDPCSGLGSPNGTEILDAFTTVATTTGTGTPTGTGTGGGTTGSGGGKKHRKHAHG